MQSRFTSCQGGQQELAVEYLLSGRIPSTIESTVRAMLRRSQGFLLQLRTRISALRDQLREQARYHWDSRSESRKDAHDAAQRRLQQLHGVLEELRESLRTLGQMGQDKVCEFRDVAQMQFGKIEAQVIDAQEFLASSMAAVWQKESANEGSAETSDEASSTEAEGAEALEAAVSASEDTALQAIAAVDEFLQAQGESS